MRSGREAERNISARINTVTKAILCLEKKSHTHNRIVKIFSLLSDVDVVVLVCSKSPGASLYIGPLRIVGLGPQMWP